MAGICCRGADGKDLLRWCGWLRLAAVVRMADATVVVRMAGTCCGVADGRDLVAWMAWTASRTFYNCTISFYRGQGNTN